MPGALNPRLITDPECVTGDTETGDFDQLPAGLQYTREANLLEVCDGSNLSDDSVREMLVDGSNSGQEE